MANRHIKVKSPIVASEIDGKGGWNNAVDVADEDYQNIVKAWRLQQVNL